MRGEWVWEEEVKVTGDSGGVIGAASYMKVRPGVQNGGGDGDGDDDGERQYMRMFSAERANVQRCL